MDVRFLLFHVKTARIKYEFVPLCCYRGIASDLNSGDAASKSKLFHIVDTL